MKLVDTLTDTNLPILKHAILTKGKQKEGATITISDHGLIQYPSSLLLYRFIPRFFSRHNLECTKPLNAFLIIRAQKLPIPMRSIHLDSVMLGFAFRPRFVHQFGHILDIELSNGCIFLIVMVIA